MTFDKKSKKGQGIKLGDNKLFTSFGKVGPPAFPESKPLIGKIKGK